MVSVHQLFSDELPDEDLALGSVLKKRRRLLQRRQRRSLLQTFPRPNLGFSEDLDVAPHILEATVEQASIQRAKASRRLRAALLRNGVVPRSSTRSPTRWGSPPPCKTSEASVPAVFPFPEPIPQEIPPRRRSTQSRAASSLSARTSPTPGDERLGSPIPSAPSAPTSRPSSRNNVPAVFPFPEPIPHEVPRRLRRETPSGAAEIERKPSPEPEGAMKLRVHDPAFVAEQRRIANGWIQETAPQGAVRNGKRPGALWLLLKKEMEHQRERHRTAFRNMPCMPFDVWLLMKDEEDIATAGGSKVEPPEVKEERKHYYRRLGQRRRQMLLGLSVHDSLYDESDRPSHENSFRVGSKQ